MAGRMCPWILDLLVSVVRGAPGLSCHMLVVVDSIYAIAIQLQFDLFKIQVHYKNTDFPRKIKTLK